MNYFLDKGLVIFFMLKLIGYIKGKNYFLNVFMTVQRFENGETEYNDKVEVKRQENQNLKVLEFRMELLSSLSYLFYFPKVLPFLFIFIYFFLAAPRVAFGILVPPLGSNLCLLFRGSGWSPNH